MYIQNDARVTMCDGSIAAESINFGASSNQRMAY